MIFYQVEISHPAELCMYLCNVSDDHGHVLVSLKLIGRSSCLDISRLSKFSIWMRLGKKVVQCSEINLHRCWGKMNWVERSTLKNSIKVWKRMQTIFFEYVLEMSTTSLTRRMKWKSSILTHCRLADLLRKLKWNLQALRMFQRNLSLSNKSTACKLLRVGYTLLKTKMK